MQNEMQNDKKSENIKRLNCHMEFWLCSLFLYPVLDIPNSTVSIFRKTLLMNLRHDVPSITSGYGLVAMTFAHTRKVVSSILTTRMYIICFVFFKGSLSTLGIHTDTKFNESASSWELANFSDYNLRRQRLTHTTAANIFYFSPHILPFIRDVRDA